LATAAKKDWSPTDPNLYVPSQGSGVKLSQSTNRRPSSNAETALEATSVLVESTWAIIILKKIVRPKSY